MVGEHCHNSICSRFRFQVVHNQNMVPTCLNIRTRLVQENISGCVQGVLVRSISEGNFCCAQATMELITAARNGDIAAVRRLLTEGHVGVNVTDKVGVSFEHDSTAIEHRRDSDVVEKMQPRESAPRRSDQG